jgi:hypothetical protein
VVYIDRLCAMPLYGFLATARLIRLKVNGQPERFYKRPKESVYIVLDTFLLQVYIFVKSSLILLRFKRTFVGFI